MVINSSSVAVSADSSRAHGTLIVHASTKAMSAPIEWVLSDLTKNPVKLDWYTQTISPSMVRASYEWAGSVGLAAKIATGLKAIPHIRFEVTEMSSGPDFNQRFCFTPNLGIFRADINVHGDVVINEQRLRHLMETKQSNLVELQSAIDSLLGTAWDVELEPFRVAMDSDVVRIAHRIVG
ncbi:MAG: hypothetical protein RL228_449 [Actinomycetota bacterium]|jgi:hypothetical protein